MAPTLWDLLTAVVRHCVDLSFRLQDLLKLARQVGACQQTIAVMHDAVSYPNMRTGAIGTWPLGADGRCDSQRETNPTMPIFTTWFLLEEPGFGSR